MAERATTAATAPPNPSSAACEGAIACCGDLLIYSVGGSRSAPLGLWRAPRGSRRGGIVRGRVEQASPVCVGRLFERRDAPAPVMSPSSVAGKMPSQLPNRVPNPAGRQPRTSRSQGRSPATPAAAGRQPHPATQPRVCRAGAAQGARGLAGAGLQGGAPTVPGRPGSGGARAAPRHEPAGASQPISRRSWPLLPRQPPLLSDHHGACTPMMETGGGMLAGTARKGLAAVPAAAEGPLAAAGAAAPAGRQRQRRRSPAPPLQAAAPHGGARRTPGRGTYAVHAPCARAARSAGRPRAAAVNGMHAGAGGWNSRSADGR